MTKLFVSRTHGPTSGFGDQITNDLELCVLTITTELIESLQRMQRQVLDLKVQNQGLDEVAYCLTAAWFDYAGVLRIDDRAEGLLDDDGVVIETDVPNLFDGLTPQRTELDRVLVSPLKGFGDRAHDKANEQFCAFTLSCYAKDGDVQIQASSLYIPMLDSPSVSLAKQLLG